MRTVLTFVLQLLVDSDQPEELRGSLQNIGSEAAPVNFRSQTELLAQIQIWAQNAGKNRPAENDGSSTEN